MGQCVSRKAGAVIASGHRDSLTYRIMDKPAKGDKGAGKRGGAHTRGTAMSFGFRRRPTSGIPMPITNYSPESSVIHPRSKSAGPEQSRRRDEDNTMVVHNSSSGRSTPRLVPPKVDATNVAGRKIRFGYRQPQAKFTNKVSDICTSHSVSHYNQEKQQQQQPQQQLQQQDNYLAKQPVRGMQVHNPTPMPKVRPSPVHNPPPYNNNNTQPEVTRRVSGILEPVGKYTLHTSHLPLPQFAVRMTDANSKIAKTAVNQSRKVSAASKSSSSSKEGSGTEDSGVGSQQGCPGENDVRGVDYTDGSLSRRRGIGRPRNLRMVVNGKSFDVRDVRDDDSTVTEISVIPLPKSFATASTGLVRERATQYQRVVNKDNRYTESTTSMSTTSSEGYDEGLGEEKVYKDRSRSEKIPSIKSDFSPPSSDDPEYGHGEAMADEYSLSSSDECQRSNPTQHLQSITNAAKSGALPKSALRSILLTIEDPAFAAAAATSTSLIDDETSPVDSLFDSPTASITQSDVKATKKEQVVEPIETGIDDDSPGTPTNASNSLSLSEGREFFDDEIADQPGLVLDCSSRAGGDTQSGVTSQVVTENSHTLVEANPKPGVHGKSATNSPLHGRRISRAGSVDTLSPCESIASDDLILDYERSDTSSYDDQNRVDPKPAPNEHDDAAILSELEERTVEVMLQWKTLLGVSQSQQQANDANTANNNVTGSTTNTNNNQQTNEIGTVTRENGMPLDAYKAFQKSFDKFLHLLIHPNDSQQKTTKPTNNCPSSMTSPLLDATKGAKRRTVTTSSASGVGNVPVDSVNVNRTLTRQRSQDGRDSGLSSDSSTPTAGSPIPTHRRTASNPIRIVNPSGIPRIRPLFPRTDTEKVWRTRSITDSPRSLDSGRGRQLSSPLRTPRNIQSPSFDSGDEGSLRLDRDTYQYMFQDIVSIKTMLLKLKQVIQESEENGLMRTETLNPFDSSTKNGLFCNLNEVGTADVGTSPGNGSSLILDELADLKRQVIFLRGQVEDRDKAIQDLQFQMSKLQGPNPAVDNLAKTPPCNAATQTEKTRPVSAGPSLLQALPQDGGMGPLVSWSDSWDRQQPSSLGEFNVSGSPRKSSDRIPRTIRPRQEQTSLRQNGHTTGKASPAESPSSLRSQRTRSTKPKDEPCETESRSDASALKSLIPTPRKLTTPSLIPRTSRTVPSPGRAHNNT